MRVLAGGSLIGGGIGATTTLLNHLHTLQEKAHDFEEPPPDPNTLYLNLTTPPGKPVQKPMHKRAHSHANNAWTFALSGLGGLAGTYGAYNLVRDMHQSLRKKQLQKELESAQQIYLGNLGTMRGLQKEAGQFSMLTKGVGTAYLTALLAALGSGVITNRILQKQFPATEDPNRDRPRRIVIRSANKAGVPEGDDQSFTPKSESPEAIESLLRTQMGNSKAASASGFGDLVNAAAAGQCDYIRSQLERGNSNGVALMFSAIDGSEYIKTSSVNRNLALSWVAHDPLVSSAIGPVLAAEFYDWASGICKLAGYIDQEDPAMGDALVGVAEEVTKLMRRGGYAKVAAHAKLAEHDGLPGPFKAVFMADALKKLLESGQEGEAQIPSTGNIPSSTDSPTMHGVNMEIQDDDAANFVQKNRNLVENSMAVVAH